MRIMSLDNFHYVQIIPNLGLIICLFMQNWNWNFMHLNCSQKQLFGVKMFIGLWNLCFNQWFSAYTGFKMLKLSINRKTLWNFRCFCNKMNCIIVKNQYFSVLKTGKCSHSIGESKYWICKSNRQRYLGFIFDFPNQTNTILKHLGEFSFVVASNCVRNCKIYIVFKRQNVSVSFQTFNKQ